MADPGLPWLPTLLVNEGRGPCRSRPAGGRPHACVPSPASSGHCPTSSSRRREAAAGPVRLHLGVTPTRGGLLSLQMTSPRTSGTPSTSTSTSRSTSSLRSSSSCCPANCTAACAASSSKGTRWPPCRDTSPSSRLCPGKGFT